MTFFEHFAELLGRDDVRDLVLPTRKTEDYRFFGLKPFTDIAWTRGTADSAVDTTSWRLPEAATTTLVVHNGTVVAQPTALPDGVFVAQRSQLPEAERAAVDDVLGSPVELSDDTFYALNAAADTDTVCVVVPKDMSVATPIHILHVATGTHTFSAPRVVVLLAAGAKATVVEEFRGGEGVTFTNAASHVVLGENANVHHVRVQREDEQSRHMSTVTARVGKFARYDSVHVALGAYASRNNVWVSHDGEDGWSRIDGLAMVDGTREADTHSVINNVRVRCQSHQLHKCVVDDRGHAVFNGKILVQKQAQQIDAYQLNRSLLLSPRAKVDTKPQLEIFADDVRCTHGATVGQLDDEQLFYLESRGIPHDEARATLTYAFAAEVIDSIEVKSLADDLEREAFARTALREQS